MMNRYQFPVSCDICGGTGLGDIDASAAAWDADQTVVHRDPSVCRDNLKQKAQELATKES